MSNSITLAGIGNIHTDAEGRYSLNDFHKAAGCEDRHAPDRFLRLDSTEALLEAISNSPEVEIKNPVSVTKGRYGGSYACEELIYAYGEWISGSFHLKVIRAFKALVKGDIEKAQQIAQSKPASELAPLRTQRAISLAIDNGDKIKSRLPLLGDAAMQSIYAGLVNTAAGSAILPLARIEEKHKNATEIGKMFGVSANMIGRLANQHGLKTPEYGHYELGEAQFNSSQRETFVYNAKAVERFRALLSGANDNQKEISA